MQGNTKEEYRSKLEDLELIKKVFDSYGIRFLIVYGALLGFYRDGDFLPGDDDIDIAIIDPIDYKTKKRIGWELYDLGFLPQQIGFLVFNRLEPVEAGYNGYEDTGIIVCGRNFKFTIFFFKEAPCELHDGEYVCCGKYGADVLISSPIKFYKKLDTIKIGKYKYLCPSPVKDYLKFTYGDWKNKSLRNHGLLHPQLHANLRNT